MPLIQPGIIGFFPPVTAVFGDQSIYFSYAQLLARTRKTAACVMPERNLREGWRHKQQTLAQEGLALTICSNGEESHLLLPDLCLRHNTILFYLNETDRLERFGPWASRMIFVMGVSPAVEDLRRTKRLSGQLLSMGASHQNIWRVLWNKGIPGELPEKLIEQHLGVFKTKLPYDPETTLTAENESVLLQRLKPKSQVVAQLIALAAETNRAFETESNSPPESGTPEIDWEALERRIGNGLWRSLREDSGREKISRKEIGDRIDREFHAVFLKGANATPHAGRLSQIRENILNHVTGLGPLEKFIRDESINEIMVNGPDQIFLEREGLIEKSPEKFDSTEQLRTVIDRVVGQMGRRVDLASPVCDVRLPDGSRVNVVLPPLSLSGPVMTVRRFKPMFNTLEALVKAGTVTENQSVKLRRAVAERKNIVVAGNTGAGKTTLLNVLAGLIPDEERILTLEDAAELQIPKSHVVRLETRPKNAEGLGQITMVDLLTNALRMRPDRLLIGECRGVEAVPMIQAMNTGHDGSMTTLHANSADDALKRLESLVLLGAPEWPLEIVREQIQSGLDLIVYLKRSGGERKVLEIVDV